MFFGGGQKVLDGGHFLEVRGRDPATKPPKNLVPGAVSDAFGTLERGAL